MSAHGGAALTLGPLLFHWPSEKVRDFYARIAEEAPVDTVHLGEVVCPKRMPLHAAVLAEAAETLRKAGKEVVRSTLALVLDDKDVAAIAAIRDEREFMVEANDAAALVALQGRPHAVGPFVNVYNEGTLAFLQHKGATRICLPSELNRDTIAALARDCGMALEVQVFGRLPLALSARCYHARVQGLTRDSCRFACGQDGDGMTVETLAGESLFAVNGIQTLSHHYCNLLHELDDLRQIGVHRFRLSPHATDMVAVARLFRAVLDGTMSAEAADASLGALLPDVAFSNGYYYHKRGLARVHALSDPAPA